MRFKQYCRLRLEHRMLCGMFVPLSVEHQAFITDNWLYSSRVGKACSTRMAQQKFCLAVAPIQ